MKLLKQCCTGVLTMVLALSYAGADVKKDYQGLKTEDAKLLQAHYKAGRANSPWNADWEMGIHHGTKSTEHYSQQIKSYDYSSGNHFTTGTDGQWSGAGYDAPAPYENGKATQFMVKYDAATGDFSMSLTDIENTMRTASWSNDYFSQDVNKNLNINQVTTGIKLRSIGTDYGWMISLSNLKYTSDAGDIEMDDMTLSEDADSRFLEQRVFTETGSMGSFTLSGEFTPAWTGTGVNDFSKNNFFEIYVSTANGADVPEPGCLALLGLGAFAMIRKKRNKKLA